MSESGKPFLEGVKVLRDIDGMWFTAVIEKADKRNRQYRIRYLDDGNVEDYVPENDLKLLDENSDAQCRGKQVYDPLPKPLAGLVDDDSHIRSQHRPSVTIHADPNTEEAIIINGAAEQLARGGGLKALRYLKH
jgi:Tudor domain